MTLTFQIYCSNDVFLVEMISNTKSTWKNQNCLDECKKLGKYQTRYLIRTFIFIISTWCVHHAVHQSYSFVSLLITSSPNVVSRPQAPRLRNVLRFHNFIGFASWFLRKWGTVCENWIQWAQLAQMWFQGPRPQGQIFFCGFIILLDYSHDSWENVVLPVKIGARFLDLWLDKSCEPNWPKCSF